MEALFQSCGYIATYLGTFLEGEILLLTSILSSKMGYFNYFGALIAAFFGAYTKDWIKFLIAKKQGKKLLEKKPSLNTKFDKSSKWFDKNPILYMSIYRLMYGFSTLIILMSGIKGSSYKQFAITSAISIMLWVGIVGGFGYFCAEVMMENISYLSDHKLQVIITLATIGLLYWFFVRRPHEKHCFEKNATQNT